MGVYGVYIGVCGVCGGVRGIWDTSYGDTCMEVYGVCVRKAEKAIWLDIARVCGHIFMSCRQVQDLLTH